MVRKYATAATIAAGMIFTVANTEGSDAFAQETDPALRIAAQAEADLAAAAAEETVPVFVESEMVQPLPDEEATQDADLPQSATSAASLRELVALTPTDGALSEEMMCLAGAVYFEARGEPLAGQLAVAQTVINRAESRLFPSSYCGVVTQRAQFSFVKNGRIPQARTSSAAWRKAKAVARIAHQGLWDSAAADSLYFHATYVRPSWSRKKVALATIESHIFYK